MSCKLLKDHTNFTQNRGNCRPCGGYVVIPKNKFVYLYATLKLYLFYLFIFYQSGPKRRLLNEQLQSKQISKIKLIDGFNYQRATQNDNTGFDALPTGISVVCSYLTLALFD